MQKSIDEFHTQMRAKGGAIEPLLTYKTTAAILDCSASKVQKMVLAGELPFIKVGNETRIIPDDLRAWIRMHRRAPDANVLPNSDPWEATARGLAC